MTIFTPNRIGFAVATLYLAGALWVVITERRHPGFLPTMGTGLVTAPITLPLEWIGRRPNLRNAGVVAALLSGNFALVFFVFSGMANLLLGLFWTRGGK